MGPLLHIPVCVPGMRMTGTIYHVVHVQPLLIFAIAVETFERESWALPLFLWLMVVPDVIASQQPFRMGESMLYLFWLL